MLPETPRPVQRNAVVPLLIMLVCVACIAMSACGSSGPSASKGTVSVAYAGSLVNLMEHKLGPAFQSATGYTYQGQGAGSTAIANQIKSHLIHPDVFISASAAA